MNFLASVLPGIRALRAPLTAGLLLLLALWLSIEPHIGDPADATGVYRALVRLASVADAFGIVTLVGFTAYIIGSLWLVAIQVLGNAAHVATRQLAYNSILQLLPKSIPDKIDAIVQPRPTGQDATRLQAFIHARATQVIQKPSGTQDYEHREAVQRATHILYDRVFLEDWRWLPQGIVGDKPQLYAEIDRYNAEAEFRSALIGPVTVLAIIVAARVPEPAWVPVALGLGCLVLVVLLVVARRDATLRANFIMTGGILSGHIQAPTLDAAPVHGAYSEALKQMGAEEALLRHQAAVRQHERWEEQALAETHTIHLPSASVIQRAEREAPDAQPSADKPSNALEFPLRKFTFTPRSRRQSTESTKRDST